MQINPANKLVIFVGAIAFVLWGGYNIIKASYVAAAWNDTEGVVTGFEKYTFSCGRGVGNCFELVVAYEVNGKRFTVNSEEKFDNRAPVHLKNEIITVYYNPANPYDAALANYGPGSYGTILFVIGILVLFLFWLFREKVE